MKRPSFPEIAALGRPSAPGLRRRAGPDKSPFSLALTGGLEYRGQRGFYRFFPVRFRKEKELPNVPSNRLAAGNDLRAARLAGVVRGGAEKKAEKTGAEKCREDHRPHRRGPRPGF